MNEMQEVKTNQITEMLKAAIVNDAEIKAAILNDANAVARILQSNIIDELKQELKTQKLILKYNYFDATDNAGNLQEGYKTKFLKTCKSENTRNGYNYALKDFETFCNQHHMQTPIAATPGNIDDWLIQQKANNKAAATIRRNAGAISAFFTYIERESNFEIRNPIRGTRQRPKVKPAKQNKFYSIGQVDATRLAKIDKELQTIVDAENNDELKAIMCCMKNRGLRCGAFEKMSLYGNQFKTESKGETIKGTLPAICVDAINAAGLKHDEPFAQWESNRVKQNVKNHVAKLFAAGVITFKYSAHDFRHFFALTEYMKDKDIYRVSKLLNHSSIAITENYLRGLNVIL